MGDIWTVFMWGLEITTQKLHLLLVHSTASSVPFMEGQFPNLLRMCNCQISPACICGQLMTTIFMIFLSLPSGRTSGGMKATPLTPVFETRQLTSIRRLKTSRRTCVTFPLQFLRLLKARREETTVSELLSFPLPFNKGKTFPT